MGGCAHHEVREGGRIVNIACLLAVGVNGEGHREILGIDVATTEDGAGWLAFFRSLVARGLSGTLDTGVSFGVPVTMLQMEGRAIARPNLRKGRRCLSHSAASMEGRAIARPNQHGIAVLVGAKRASMEGRAIARPNQDPTEVATTIEMLLQWRAGQLPGQTWND